ncbi:hypothetical protein EON79_03035, partial [bacterium]
MMHLRAFGLPLLIALAAGASAQLDVPTLRPGQFVYAIPESFTPPLIEREGMRQIQQAIAKLKFPFYVFLVKELPGRGDLTRTTPNSAGYNRLRDRISDEATIELTDRLRAQARFDQNKGSVFMLSFDPRAYTYRPGSLWKTKYGFANLNGNNPHASFLETFKRYASKPANDPKQGIIEMAKAIDAHLDEISDPAKVEARAYDVAAQNLERSLIAGRSVLDEADRLKLPASGLRSAVAAAEKGGNLKALRRATEALDRETLPVQGELQRLRQQAEEERAAQLAIVQERIRQDEIERGRKSLTVVGILLVLGGAGAFGYRRRKRYNELRAELTGVVEQKRQQIANARNQAYRLFQERDTVAGASKYEGHTKRVIERVASDLDAITIGLEAMATLIDSAEKEGAKASLFACTPLDNALAALRTPFDFDTGKVNRSDLFGNPTEVVRVQPNRFAKEIGDRFTGTSEAWERLKTAMNLQAHPLEDALPHARWTELQAEALALGLHPALLEGHPLAGDEASDRAFYAGLSREVWKDPVGTFAKIEEAKRWETATGEAFARIRQVKRDLDEARVEAIPPFDTAPVAPKDDPKVRLHEARQAEEAFEKALAHSDSTAEIVAKGEIVLAAYAR